MEEKGLTQDIRIMANPNLIRNRVKKEVSAIVDEIKADLVEESEKNWSTSFCTSYNTSKTSGDHIEYIIRDIKKWAKMQGYIAKYVLINGRSVIELRPYSLWRNVKNIVTNDYTLIIVQFGILTSFCACALLLSILLLT